MNYHPNPQKRALYIFQRPWWVCCYGIAPYFNALTRRWTVHSGEFMEGNCQTWTLMDIKTFKDAKDAYVSLSFRKLYAPFDNPFVRVFLMPRTRRSIRLLTEFRLYPREETAVREYTFHTERTITVQAETLQEAEKLVEAELHCGESILSCDAEDEYEVTVVAVIDQ